MTVYVVTASDVRDYLRLDTNNPLGNSQYTDAMIQGHILAAQEFLEHNTGRWFTDRPATTYTTTTNGAPQVFVPGFRTVTAATLSGAGLTVNSTVWPMPDPLGTGMYVAIQVRPFANNRRGPWWYALGGATTNWFDTNADSPYDPRNYGGAWNQSSLPNDLVVTGDGGYASGSEPAALKQAVKLMAAFYTMRPASILADVAITPSGGVLTYSTLPAEVRDFISAWRMGQQAVAV